MIRSAIKFSDINTFLRVAAGMGFNGEIKRLVFEEGQPPYYSAFLIPVDLLPKTFDLSAIDQFGGVMTEVEEVQYYDQRFTSDFMVFRKSKRGYVEIEPNHSSTFAVESHNDWATGEMNYVIIFEDGGGKEFFLAANDTLVSMQGESQHEEPKLLKTNKQVSKQMDSLRKKYASSCQVYAIEQRDFEDRKNEIN